MSGTVYTVGHSTHDLETFEGMLTAYGVTELVDVRKLPGSTRYPHFNEDVLAEALPGHGITYRRSEGLTGRRKVSKTVPFEINGFWRNRSFHNYADHALGEEFATAFEDLRAGAMEHTTVVMCSEAVWWRCHRRIIADHLLAAGDEVVHIMGPGQAVAATLTEGAVVDGSGPVRYPEQEE